MAADETPGSPRRQELLEAAYRYALRHGIADLSLRPLAAAVGSSPRVLLYLFGSKDGLVRALLERARADELDALARLGAGDGALPGGAERLWAWLSAAEHRALLTLWVEAYARSLTEPGGPWHGFAAATVEDWLRLLTEAEAEADADADDGAPDPTAVLALLRGAMLDLLATGDTERTTAAVHRQLRLWSAPGAAIRPRPAGRGARTPRRPASTDR